MVERRPFFGVLSHKSDIRQNCVISDIFSYHIGGTCPVKELSWSRNGAFCGTKTRPRRTSPSKERGAGSSKGPKSTSLGIDMSIRQRPIRRDRQFLHEYPQEASAWNGPCVMEIAELDTSSRSISRSVVAPGQCTGKQGPLPALESILRTACQSSRCWTMAAISASAAFAAGPVAEEPVMMEAAEEFWDTTIAGCGEREMLVRVSRRVRPSAPRQCNFETN